MFKLIIVCIFLFQLTTAVPPQFQTANGKLSDSNLATGLETAKELLKNLKMTALKLNSIDSQLKEGKRDLTENGTFSSSSISGSSVAADVGSSLTVGFDLLNNLKAAAALLNGLKQAAHDVAEAADEKILGDSEDSSSDSESDSDSDSDSKTNSYSHDSDSKSSYSSSNSDSSSYSKSKESSHSDSSDSYRRRPSYRRKNYRKPSSHSSSDSFPDPYY